MNYLHNEAPVKVIHRDLKSNNGKIKHFAVRPQTLVNPVLKMPVYSVDSLVLCFLPSDTDELWILMYSVVPVSF